jgi:type IV secretory pathway TrbL component
MVTKQHLLGAAMGAVTVAALGTGALTFAQTTTDTTTTTATAQDCAAGKHGFGRGHGVFGTVTGVSGTTLTVTMTNPKDNTTTIYTVDATNAKVLTGDGTSKPTESSLSNIKTGDTVMVAGTVNGQTITAEHIIDGPVPKWGPRSQTTTQ